MSKQVEELLRTLIKKTDIIIELLSKQNEPKEKEDGRCKSIPEDLEQTKTDFKEAERKRVISFIKRLRKNGGTYKEIAEVLNFKKVPTFSGFGKWHSQTVHRLYADN